MRGFFGLAGLLIALVIVGLLVKKQLAATQQAIPALRLPAVPGAASPDAPPATTVKQQSRQIEQQYKQAIEGVMQTTRPVPDDN